MRIVHEPVGHGVGWPGDVKRIALSIDKLRSLGFTPKINSTMAIRRAALHITGES